MKIILWYNIRKDDDTKEGRVFSALLSHLKKNHNVKHLNGHGYKSEYFEPCDLAFVWSFANSALKIIQDCKARNTPVIVIENGYFNKDYLSFGINKHYYMPKTYDGSRFKLFNKEIKARKLNKGNKILLADRGHLVPFFKRIVNRLPKNKEVIYRPHPLKPNFFIEGIKKETGDVNWNEIFAVITDCSAFGNEALLNGVPVFCKETASYSVLGNVINKDTDFSKPKKPNKKEIEYYFNRLCFTQWKLKEVNKMLELYFKELQNEK